MPNANNATHALVENLAAVVKLMASIQRGIDDRTKTDGIIDWADVGDMGHLKSNLQDISDRMHGTGEYAKAAQ